jgi:hypothetical protein
LENAPWDTLEDLTDEDRLKILRKEWNKDECDHHGKSAHHGIAVSELVHNNSSSIQAQDLSTQGAVRETCLPSGRELVRGVTSLPMNSPYFSVNFGKA